MAPIPRRRRTVWILGAIALLLALLAVVWDWNWFRPLVERQASSALGRPVTLGHFDVKLRWHPWLIAEDIAVANPPEFPADSRLGSIERLAVHLNPWPLLHGRLVLPDIEIDKPVGDLGPGPSGKPNYVFEALQSDEPRDPAARPPAVDIGSLTIRDGDVHIVEPTFKSDFRLKIRTVPRADGGEADIRVDIEGRYADAPIEGRFVGGSVLSLRDPARPYPVDLLVRNGDTQVTLKGTLQNPIAFAGAALELDFRGNDLADLYPLTGVPLPPSPPYHLSGRLDYADGVFRFRRFEGHYGQSDLAGEVSVLPGRGGRRRKVTMVAHSDKVVWSDLSGFVGATPGKPGAPNDTPAQKASRRQQAAKGRLLPDTPVSLPRIRAADLDVTYKIAKIESDHMPVDTLDGHLVMEDGLIRVQPLRLGVGQGSVLANIVLDGRRDLIHTTADLDFRRVDFRRVMDKLTIFRGTGTIGGSARLEAHGNSLAAMLGGGDGGLKLFMNGGDMSALLVNLAGLDLGNSLISALGLPRRAALRCMVVDLGLQDGQLKTNTLLVDTSEANVIGEGGVDLKDERIDYRIHTEPKRMNVGSLSAPIDIKGPLRTPGILPDPGALAVRGGIAAVLGTLLTPLAALIPTIQLGLGEDNDCVAMIRELQAAPPAAKPAPAKKR